MKRSFFCFISVLTVLYCSPRVWGSGNARPSGMGGAFTAISDDAAGIFWNPAGMFLIPGWYVSMNYGTEYDLADGAQDLLDEVTALDPRSDTTNLSQLTEKLRKLDGFSFLARGGPKMEFAVAYNSAAFSISGYDLFFTQPRTDLENISEDPTSETYIGRNTSAIELSGFRIQEYALTYAYYSEFTGSCIGMTAKYMDVSGFASSIPIWSRTSWDLENTLDEVDDGAETSAGKFGIDVGLMFVGGANRVGFVGKNLKKIELTDDNDTTFSIQPQYRLGYAFSPTDRFVFAMDYNLTKNRDAFGDKMDGNEISMGFEGKLGESKWLTLRGGATIDSGGDAPLIYSSGMSLNFARMSVDAAYAVDQYGDGSRIWAGIRFFFTRTEDRKTNSATSH